jgi:carnitine 3-dehydrogenase
MPAVDNAACASPGLRWALMGKHMIYHLGGEIGGIEHFMDHPGPSFVKSWEEMAGKSLEAMAWWRDEKLVRLLRDIYE